MMKNMQSFYAKRNMDVHRHLQFLKGQGILDGVATECVIETYTKLKAGEKPHLDPKSYIPSEAEFFGRKKDKLPEKFWIERYTLQKCKERQLELAESLSASHASAKVSIMNHDIRDSLNTFILYAVISSSLAIIFGILAVQGVFNGL